MTAINNLPNPNTDDTIHEISTVISASQSSSSTSRDSSITENIATQSMGTKSIINKPFDNQYQGDLSVAKSIKTDSSVMYTEKSPREISNVGSFESEKKSQINSKSNSKSESKSTYSTTPVDDSTNKSELNVTNYSKDEFENSDYQNSTSESEIINRVNILETERKNKEHLLDKLKHKLSIVTHRRKEKSLQNHINHLDSQINVLKEELQNPHLNSSSVSLSPITKSKTPKNSKEIKILPTYNRKQSSSSSSNISKEEEFKSISCTTSASSSTLISDSVKIDEKDQAHNRSADDIDTPRSTKQIQFEDINEEYSASNQDSSELRTSSDKSRFSKELTDNGATKSKSEKFHILINEPPNDDQELVNNENDDLKMISARTIHSEISEIPLEDDLSDQEIDEISFKDDDREINKNTHHQDLYSEDFSEITSHKHSKSGPEINEISNNEIFSYESSSTSESSQSSESSAPSIPLRRKLMSRTPEDDSRIVAINSTLKIDSICEHLYREIFNEIITEYFHRTVVPPLLGLENIRDDVYDIHEQFVEEDDFMNCSIESINDQLTDGKFAPLGLLIPWNDENIFPLVELAVEQLFFARMNRSGSSLDAFNYCRENMPKKFNEINDEDEMKRIYNHWCAYRIRDKTTIEDHKLYISRLAIYTAVLEIMIDIYELDDEPLPAPWMMDEFNAMKKKKLILWQGMHAPDSLHLVKKIVHKQLASINVIKIYPQTTMINRSRQHQWFINKTDDSVDKLLIDETFQDDLCWQNYNKAIEKTIYMITDEIVANEIKDILNITLDVSDIYMHQPC